MSVGNGIGKWHRIAGAGLAAALLSACAPLSGLVTPTEAEVRLPAPPMSEFGRPNWDSPAPDALPNADWVADFDNAQLTEIVDRALARNPGLMRSEALLDAAIARRRIQRADLVPTFDASLGIQRSDGGFVPGSDISRGVLSNYQTATNARWEIDLFGRLRDGVRAQTAAAQASAADLAGLRASVAGQVANLWIDAIEAGRLNDLSAREIDAQDRIARLTLRRFEVGVVGASDVRLARSALASARALAVLREQNAATVLRQLESLMAEYPDADLAVPDDLPGLAPLEGAAGPTYVLRRRPDILAAERRIVEAGFNVDVARKALFPSLNLSGGITDQFTTEELTSSALDDIFDLATLANSISAQLSAPIFQAGRLRGNVEASRAQLEAQVASYVETVLTAYREVEDALGAEDLLAEREVALEEALIEARAAEDRLRLRYTEGLATILQLLDAQTRSLNAEGQLIGAQAERLNNRVRLHVALGGGRYGQVSNALSEPFLVVEDDDPAPVLVAVPDEPVLAAVPAEGGIDRAARVDRSADGGDI